MGGEILARLLERERRPIYALVRARDDAEARQRLERQVATLLGTARPWMHRVVAIPAELTEPDLALDPRRRHWLAERAELVIHCAASVSFTLGLAESRAINVEGTRHLLDLAETCARRGGIRCFTHVSTAYVAGDHRGIYAERDLDLGQGFRNPYERSKFDAEQLVRQRSGSAPVQILRPSIVVGDSRTGWTPAFNVLYWPLRAFARGTYPVLPARRRAPVDVVPVDFVADAVLALAGRPGTTYHLTSGPGASSVGEVIELASRVLDRPAPRLIPPAAYRRAVHPLLVRSGAEARRRALRRSEAFFPYFAVGTEYDNTLARDALEPRGIEIPLLSTYFERLIRFALAAEWGRSIPGRHEASLAHRPPPPSPRPVAPQPGLSHAA